MLLLLKGKRILVFGKIKRRKKVPIVAMVWRELDSILCCLDCSFVVSDAAQKDGDTVLKISIVRA
jgi:hypothetical protein